MFTLEDLIAAPAPPGVRLGRRPYKELINLLTRKPHRFLPPNVPELRIPADAEACALIKEMLDDVNAVRGEWGLRALRGAIEQSQVRAAGRPLGSRGRDYDIGAAVAGDDGEPCFVALSVRVRGEKGSGTLEGIRCRLLELDNTDTLRQELAAIYQGAEARDQLIFPDRPRAVWLRGAGADCISTDWAGEAEAMAATFGFRLHVFREPEVRPAQARAAIEAFAPTLLLLWDYDGRAAELTARASLDSLGVTIERLEGAWDDAIHEASRALARSRDVRPPEIFRPRTVVEAITQAKTHSQVKILPAALRSAGDSAFRRPLDVTIALNELVQAVADGALTAPGGLAQALQTGSFRYASGVSETARNSGDYRRPHKGRQIELGPHLKLGAGSPEHCLRIYWYVDDAEKEVIIGHIGEHLRDAGS